MIIKSNKETGFSLIEFSIVTTIAAILLAGAIFAGRGQILQNQVLETKEKQEIIYNAMLNYLSENSRFPCPADITDGTSDGTAASLLDNNPDDCDLPAAFSVSGTDVVYAGAIPYITLQNLTESSVIDAWGNQMVYVVQRAFVNSSDTNTPAANCDSVDDICFEENSATDITITDPNSNTVASNVPFVIISYGPNGLGAYPESTDGATVAANPDPASGSAEENNRVNQSSTITSTFSIPNGTSGEADVFDDILFFRSRNQVVYECSRDITRICVTPNSDGGLDLGIK